jgi:BA14K-like protein
MTNLKILSAAAIFSMMTATPVFAQAAIQEPGAYAFYHPNSDLGLGESWPPGPAGTMASVPFGNSSSYAYMNEDTQNRSSASSCSQRYRSYDPASGTFLGYDGVRHPCS